MSHVSQAIDSLKQELNDLTARANTVVAALRALEGDPRVRTPEIVLAEKGKTTPVAKKAPVKKAPVKKVATKAANGQRELPDTGGDWFSSLFTNEPQTRAQLMGKATQKVGFSMTAAQKKKLSDRLGFAITQLKKKDQINIIKNDDGTFYSRKA